MPQHFMVPTTRELRAQAVHRLQVGIFGLATMLLLVGLANIIMDRAKQVESTEGNQASLIAPASTSQSKPADPLADIGVAPAAEPTSAAKHPTRSNGTGGR